MQKLTCFAFALAIYGSASPVNASTCAPQREAVTVPLSGFASQGEIVVPPRGRSPESLLVLFPGSDVADMDGAIEGSKGTIVSRPMRQVAERASVRRVCFVAV